MTTTSSDDAPRRLPNEPIQETLTGGEGVRDTLVRILNDKSPARSSAMLRVSTTSAPASARSEKATGRP
jgi:hypothetical protein